jgi:hypothetical protein
MQRKIQEHEALLQDDQPAQQKLKFLRLNEDIPADEGTSGDGPLPEHKATVVNYNPETGELDDAEEVENVISPFGEEYSEGDYVVVVGHNGKFVPVMAAAEKSDWYRLTSNLTAGGTASANPMKWNASGGGSMSPDTSTVVTVKDVLGIFSGKIGDKIKVKERTAANGTVYCVEWAPPKVDDIESVEQTVVTGIASDGTVTKKKLKVLESSDAASSTVGTTKTVVTNVSSSGVVTKATMRVFEMIGDGADSQIGVDTTVLETVGVSIPDLTRSPKTIRVLSAGSSAAETYHTAGPCNSAS